MTDKREMLIRKFYLYISRLTCRIAKYFQTNRPWSCNIMVSDSQNEQQSVYKAPLIIGRQRSYCFNIFVKKTI